MLIVPSANRITPGRYGGNDANTLLLLHCEGSDASTTFTDSSSFGRTVTAVGNAQIDNAQAKFGSTSALFDGSGDRLSVADSNDWAFGTNPFTVDMWIRPASLPGGGWGLAGHYTDGNNGWRIYVNSSGGLLCDLYASGSQVMVMSSSNGLISTGTWYHVALVRSGNDWAIFVNGSAVAGTTSAASIGNYTQVLAIGAINASNSASANGWIDEVRISNVARWTSPFIPLNAAYW